MAVIKLPPKTFRITNDADLVFELTPANIAEIEHACAKYREETKLPETMEECRKLINCMTVEQRTYTLKRYGIHEFVREGIDTNECNAFAARWQAEKLHALACMEQVWIALHDGDFGWIGKCRSEWFITVLFDGAIWIGDWETRMNPFPFRTRELAEQARRILTDDLIKCAFRVK